MSTFAAIWWIVGATQSGRASLMVCAIGLVISGLMVVLARGQSGAPVPPEQRKRLGRIVRIASALEGVFIVAAVIVLSKLGLRDLIAPAVAIIVGLHFLPLARWFPARIYYLTAALIVAAGVAGTLVDDLQSRILIVCIGTASALWLSCGIVLLRAYRRSQSAPRGLAS